MTQRVVRLFRSYPRQFWVLFASALISAAGGNLIWPFMTIYLHEKLMVPLATVGVVFTITSVAGYFSQLVGGPFVDRFGRKPAILFSLVAQTFIVAAFGFVGSLQVFAVLFVLSSLAWPLSGIGINAMVADLVEPERRPSAYALQRIAMNVGVAIGPAIGGFIATKSYTLSFLLAASSFAILILPYLFFVRETRPETPLERERGERTGYGRVLRDLPFLGFAGAFALMNLAYAQMLIYLPVYIKENYGIPESGYGFILATNALMVVLFQFAVTRVTERYPRLPVMALGTLLIATGLGSVAFFHTYFLFLLSMIIYTVGELITAPTATAFVADVAPVTMRGTYMAVYSICFGFGFGLGPMVGGVLHDTLGPAYIWHGAFLTGLISTAAFLLLNRVTRPAPVEVEPSMGSPQ
ncbi:MAG: MDR family MFS transporter [Anaerolineae bacterium]